MRLLSSQGELVRGRCRSTNQCDYCARLGAVENSELLALDAVAGSAPQVWACLTTALSEPDPAHFYRARELVIRALRRRWPECEYAALVEFTTGYGTRSGGARRPHWNLLLKGIPLADLDAAADVIKRVWCERPELVAVPDAQHVGRVSEFGGLMRYIALHFQKSSQAPPAGWRGHRFLKSRGYLSQATPSARLEARESLALKRELRAALLRGLQGEEAAEAAERARAIARDTSWRLYDATRLLTSATRGQGRPDPDAAAVPAPEGLKPAPERRTARPEASAGIGAAVDAQTPPTPIAAASTWSPTTHGDAALTSPPARPRAPAPLELDSVRAGP